jgi:hypothetical protein
MTIKDSMHQANQELTADFAYDLYIKTGKDIDAHSCEIWNSARDHAATMLMSGWSLEEAATAAGDKFGVPSRPVHLLVKFEIDVYGWEVYAA